MTVPKQWEVTKGCKLCFRCLADGHRGEECFKSRVCGLNRCRSYHHRMFHKDGAEVKSPLELMAAVVGLQLAEAVRNILNLPKHESLFW